MFDQVSVSGGTLVVGAPDIVTACQHASIAAHLNAVAAPLATLSELVTSAETIVGNHDFVLFETEVSNEDIAALDFFVNATQGNTKFVALVDDNLPLSKVRKLDASGAADVLPLAIKADALVQALADVAKVPEDNEPKATKAGPGAKVFSVAQSRGGAGATTVAVNLAATLAGPIKKRKPSSRVLLLDLDLQFGNAGTYLDIEDNGALFGLISENSLPDPKKLEGAVQACRHGFDVLTAPTVFVPLTSMSPAFVAHIIEVFRENYDYIVIDLPRATLDWLTPAILATDRLIMVSDASVPCIRQAKRLIDLYRESRITLPVELVMNREKNRFFGSETIRDAEDLLGLKVATWIPNDPSGERYAIDLGRPTSLVRSKGRKAYRKLAKDLSLAGKSSSNDIV